jgi:two-component system, LytTR family, sensor kinase
MPGGAHVTTGSLSVTSGAAAHWSLRIRGPRANDTGMNAPAVRSSTVVLLSLAVGVFFTSQVVLMALTAGRPVQIEWDVFQELLYWLVFALLAPHIMRLAGRWPLLERPVAPHIIRHAATSLALALAGTVAAFALHFAAARITGTLPRSQALAWIVRVRPSLVWGEFMGVAFYWTVVAVSTALQFRDLYTAERVSAAELATRSAMLEGQLTRAQLDALRSQLRPHFLFNTLNAISVLALEDPARARHMVVRLGSLLRRSLDEEEHEVPLRQELVFLDEYLDIQRARFGDRLVVTLDVDAAAAEAKVPVLLLQPLVENAIEHGWPEKDATTAIALRASRTNGALRLSVEDNGPGAGDDARRREGIGLSNTRERLRRLYGDRAALTLGAARDGADPVGTRVEITIPFTATPA